MLGEQAILLLTQFLVDAPGDRASFDQLVEAICQRLSKRKLLLAHLVEGLVLFDLREGIDRCGLRGLPAGRGPSVGLLAFVAARCKSLVADFPRGFVLVGDRKEAAGQLARVAATQGIAGPALHWPDVNMLVRAVAVVVSAVLVRSFSKMFAHSLAENSEYVIKDILLRDPN